MTVDVVQEKHIVEGTVERVPYHERDHPPPVARLVKSDDSKAFEGADLWLLREAEGSRVRITLEVMRP